MATTLKDVAKLSGVHPSTVSRVLRSKENIPISEETRNRILRAVRELNYQPDQTARALRLRKSNAIGLIVPDILNSFFAGVARSIEIECAKAGYTLLVSETNEDQENEIRTVYDLHSRGVDGLVIAPVQKSSDHIRDLCQKKFPFVLIDRCFEDIETNAVISDNEKAAFHAIKYLVDMNHKQIAFLSSRRDIYPIHKRLAGYLEAMKIFNGHYDTNLIVGNGSKLKDGFDATTELLSREQRPTAILSSGNMITIGAIEAIYKQGLAIPDDISLIAFTDSIYSPYLICPLTTVSHSINSIAVEAFSLLHKHLITPEQSSYSTIKVDTSFNIRKSTARLS